MTIKESLIKGSKSLKASGIKTNQLDTEVLMQYSLGCTKEWLYANSQNVLSKNQENKFLRLIVKRRTRIPIAYITGEKEFYGLNFLINKTILIPRPETELLVEKVLDYMENKTGKFQIAEIGTGSGCISIALAKNNKKVARIYATDISRKALEIAIINAEKNNVSGKIIFSKESLLSKSQNKFDIIVSNPPYIKPRKNMQKETTYESKRALFPSKNFLKNLLETLNDHLKNNGYAFIEIDPYQKNEIKKIVKTHNYNLAVNFKKDYSGKFRFAIISRLA